MVVKIALLYIYWNRCKTLSMNRRREKNEFEENVRKFN